MALRVLVVEDDPKIAAFLTKDLQLEGFSVDHATDGENGLKLALTGYLMRNAGEIVSKQIGKRNGGGAPLHGQEQLRRNPGSLIFRKAYHFIEVNVTAATLTLTAWAVNNTGITTVVDQSVITP